MTALLVGRSHFAVGSYSDVHSSGCVRVFVSESESSACYCPAFYLCFSTYHGARQAVNRKESPGRRLFTVVLNVSEKKGLFYNSQNTGEGWDQPPPYGERRLTA